MSSLETMAAQPPVLPATLRLGPTHLTVSDLAGSIRFYERALGLRVHSREELARAIVRLAETRTRIEGASDHGGSEAIYLRDPDDNGRPRSCSPWRRRRQRACSERPTRARAPVESTAWSGVVDRSGIGMERAGGRGRNRVSPTYPMPMLRLPCARVSKEL
ncbi:MAG: VOC family protein [Solirubrobacteraceae bacterium]